MRRFHDPSFERLDEVIYALHEIMPVSKISKYL
jgi:hypothetical protein